MAVKTNRFKDRLKILDLSAAKVENLSSQLEDYLIGVFGNNRKIFSKTNIFGQLLAVSKEISNLNFAYIEDSLTEQNIRIAQNALSVRGLATLTGHQPWVGGASRGIVKMKLLAGIDGFGRKIVLNKGTEFRNNFNNTIYTLDITNDTLNIETSIAEINLPLIEGVRREQTFISNGTKLFTINLDETSLIDIDSIQVFVNGVLWSRVDSLYEDMHLDTETYIIKTGFGNLIDIIFGNSTHGKIPSNGSQILIKYVQHNGIAGNIQEQEETEFIVVDGVTDINGNTIEIDEFVSIEKVSGFLLGSDGEDINLTREIAGYNSRSLALSSSEAFESYLGRFSGFISNVDVWTNEDSLVFNMLVLPNIINKINSLKEYLSLNTSDFILSSESKANLQSSIENSRRQKTTSEIRFIDPLICKYAIFIYVEAEDSDEKQLASDITDSIIDTFITCTFSNFLATSEKFIPQSLITHNLHSNVDKLIKATMVIVSQENENAKINGFYDVEKTIQNGAVLQKTTERIVVEAGDNPNLGFNETNDILVNNRRKIPILGTFEIQLDDLNTQLLPKAITIYLKDQNIWREIEY